MSSFMTKLHDNDGSEDQGDRNYGRSPPSVGTGAEENAARDTESSPARNELGGRSGLDLSQEISPGKSTQEVADYLELRLGKTGEMDGVLARAIKIVIENDIDSDVWLGMIAEQSMTKKDKCQALTECFGIQGPISQAKLISDGDKAVKQAWQRDQAREAELKGSAKREPALNVTGSPGRLGVNDLSNIESANKSRLSTDGAYLFDKGSDEAFMMGKPSEGCPVWKSTAEHLPNTVENQKLGVGLTAFVGQFSTSLSTVYDSLFQGKTNKAEASIQMQGLTDFSWALDRKFGIRLYNSSGSEIQRHLRTAATRELTRDADNTKSLSAAQIIATIVEQVDHRSAEKATKMISDLSNLQPVLKPHLLEKRLEELQEKFDEMDRHGVVHPKEYKLIDLRKSYSKIVEELGINSKLYRNLIKCENNTPDDVNALMSALKDACFELVGVGAAAVDKQGGRPPWRRPAAQGTTTQNGSFGAQQHQPEKRICYFNREGKTCPSGDKCSNKHGIGSGKTCTNPIYVSTGICEFFNKCIHMHPWDTTKWGSIKDVLAKAPAFAQNKFGTTKSLEKSLDAVSAMMEPFYEDEPRPIQSLKAGASTDQFGKWHVEAGKVPIEASAVEGKFSTVLRHRVVYPNPHRHTHEAPASTDQFSRWRTDAGETPEEMPIVDTVMCQGCQPCVAEAPVTTVSDEPGCGQCVAGQMNCQQMYCQRNSWLSARLSVHVDDPFIQNTADILTRPIRQPWENQSEQYLKTARRFKTLLDSGTFEHLITRTPIINKMEESMNVRVDGDSSDDDMPVLEDTSAIVALVAAAQESSDDESEWEDDTGDEHEMLPWEAGYEESSGGDSDWSSGDGEPNCSCKWAMYFGGCCYCRCAMIDTGLCTECGTFLGCQCSCDACEMGTRLRMAVRAYEYEHNIKANYGPIDEIAQGIRDSVYGPAVETVSANAWGVTAEAMETHHQQYQYAVFVPVTSTPATYSVYQATGI
jgi:hypothetical protein